MIKQSVRLVALPVRRAFHASTNRLALQTVNVPSMGDSISEGTLVEVLKKAGDTVHADEVVLVLETDKVSRFCACADRSLCDCSRTHRCARPLTDLFTMADTAAL